MDAARTQLVGRLLRILLPALALWVASEMADLRGLDPEAPRFVLDVPSEHDVSPGDAGRSAEAGDGPG
jgi:hypothetical protein